MLQPGFTNLCPIMAFLRKLRVRNAENLKHASMGLGDCLCCRISGADTVAAAQAGRADLKECPLRRGAARGTCSEGSP